MNLGRRALFFIFPWEGQVTLGIFLGEIILQK